MKEEEKNKLKRRTVSLTIDEWLGFFLIPVNLKSKTMFPTDDFNDTEIKRFVKFGFDRKLKQSKQARFLGIVFYILITILLVVTVG